MTLSLSVIIIETTVLFIIGAAALIGNVSLFLVVYENKNLRTNANIFILNLAAADILVSGVSMPVTAVTIIKQRWIFGHATCVVFGFFTILSFIASVMFLGMIAINRYFYIVKWKTYSHTFNKKKVWLYGATVWIVSVLLASLPLFGWGKYDFIPGKSYCFVDWSASVYYAYFMIAVCFFGPLSAVIFSYHQILNLTITSKIKVGATRNNLTLSSVEIIHAPSKTNEPETSSNLDDTAQHRNAEATINVHVEIIHARSKTNEPQTSSNLDDNARQKAEATINVQLNNDTPQELITIDCAPMKMSCNEKKTRNSRGFLMTPEETRLTNTFILVVAAFLVSWTPFVVTMFFDMYCPRSLPHAVDFTSLLLGYANSMCNPILYGLRNSAFAQGFLNLYSRFLPKRSGCA
ncbi:D(2) dopamine receptor-like [Montipora foliosa]|uniref:D(2) dopamine receptor-like n=1 Tax=Montipora foliosa TaxID=591990 RepID=UPI0035F17A68